ncbi:hypothetical protein LOD99_6495 [Oopsacas minuta]|uniref:DNA mismatch repair protein S5 domain-containing protein n=1 Tax=Oopsacas minuta TaxID=111878 RepID=A0AAV7JMR0_9METZ|nr:hypothetical protein LOD99_6495 [Oopsacas minuta]
MKHLPSETVQLLTSGQIITSVSYLVKELVENALDAGAEHVEVVIEKFGQSKVQIVDNGNGIPKCEISQVCKRHHTSKLTHFEDLAQVNSYGFRGEALHSICSIANVEISSRTSNEELGERHIFDHDGNLSSSHPISIVVGTRIIVTDLFTNMPVRKQIFSSPNKCKEEIKQITLILQAYKIAHPITRFTFKHNGQSLLQLPKADDIGSAITLLHGKSVLDCLNHTYVNRDNFSLTGYIPCLGKQTVSRSNSDLSILIINKRPGIVPSLNTFIRKFLIEHLDLPSRMHPIFFLHLDVLPDKIDINVSANKGTFLLHDQVSIIESLKEEWEILYKHKDVGNKTEIVLPATTTKQLEMSSNCQVSDDVTVMEATDAIPNPNGSGIVEELNYDLNFELTIDDWSQESLDKNKTKKLNSTPNILNLQDTPVTSGKKQLNSTLKDRKTSNKRKSKQSPKQSTISFTQEITRPSPDHVISTPSLKSIKQQIAKSSDLKSPTPGSPPCPILIGPIEGDKFIFHVAPSLYIGDKHILLEQYFYCKLLQSYQLKTSPLSKPLVIPSDLITTDLQYKIAKLKGEQSVNQIFQLVDKSIVNNGFEVSISLTVSNVIEKVEITGLASLYGGDAVKQFILLLDEIDPREFTKDRIVRTELVQQYLRDEAIRELECSKEIQSESLQEVLQLEWEREKINEGVYKHWYHYFSTL